VKEANLSLKTLRYCHSVLMSISLLFSLVYAEIRKKSYNTFGCFLNDSMRHVYPVADRIFVLSRGSKIGEFKKEEISMEQLTELMILK